ncbi:TAXI family TRAP transporter solute-binding subunit [Natrarchaeobaculum aegyptiacum]|uniref:C4-dicarboxylate ABC transporter substrate-binding protein n=1 Tax=Natrarchaeobaculum aegyptiacum TaxID=745377 RepID=A0A2Z2HTN3_9EURY|nr:TAXI family TRAP transporter solute-binding subunit [Natrarchaeobaculum aegyptiacum]ARS90522.1 C4-dicarboxylate ABC transporter substrate-binding protein [Natrarchaeobaculum aegyptiacum]
MARDRYVSRRKVLASAAAGTTLSVAGCLGGSDTEGTDEQTIRMQTATEGTTAYAANGGLAAVVNEHTDDLFVEARPSAGSEANIGALMREDVEMVYVQNWTMNQILEGVEPFHEVNFEPAQILHFYSLPWFFLTADDELETLSDIGPETQVNPTPEGSGTAPALEHALSFAADDYERVSYGYSEQGPAMEEGRLDVGSGTYLNFSIEPGWLQEIGGTVDTKILSVPDDVREEWEADPGMAVESFPTDELESIADGPDEIATPVMEYNFISRTDLDYDTVYGFLDVLYENREELGNYHAVLELLEAEENMTELLFDDVPMHAAAYDFWDEHGLADGFERADEP